MIFFGDSILRNCADNFADLEIDYDLQVFVYPGATVNSLRRSIREEFGNTYEFDTAYVLIHIGTNNLSRGFWERDKKYFLELYYTLKEIFRSSTIIFSLILPRWDSEELYNQSLAFNTGLQRLCGTLTDCLSCDLTEDFSYSLDLFAKDGLHLNSSGKHLFAHGLHHYLLDCFRNCKKESKSPALSRIPKELTLLNPPKKCKVIKKPWTETNLDLVLFLQRERKSTKCPHVYRKPRRRPVKKPANPDDGFVKPSHYVKVQPPPPLPPNRHVPEKIPSYIPYVTLETHNTFKTSSKCPVPASLKPFIIRKKLGKRKRRKIANGRKKRRRKVK